MVVTINRNDKLFSPQIADELNKSFYTINQKIGSYKAEELDYKYNVQFVSNSDSFILDNVFCIREKFVSAGNYETFTKIKDLPRSVPFDVWTQAVSLKGDFLTVHIKDKEIFVYGLSRSDDIFYLYCDVILP